MIFSSKPLCKIKVGSSSISLVNSSIFSLGKNSRDSNSSSI